MPETEISSPGNDKIQSWSDPILVIGAGIVGLTIAQACRKKGIPYRIFERDPSAHHRDAGWAITLHWSLPTFLDLVPQDIADNLPDAYVNPERGIRDGEGNFFFFDLQTAKPVHKTPASRQIRFNREKLRRVLMKGINVEWSKTLDKFETGEQGARTIFKDGTSASGYMIIGCDGSRSRVRQLLCPETYQNEPLPVKVLGVTAIYAKATELQAQDISYLQGGDPRTSVFLWFSFLDTPQNNCRKGENANTYLCHIQTSWPYKPGFLDREQPLDIPESPSERLALMRELSDGWAEPFRSMVHNLPADVIPKDLNIADWPPGPEGGRVWDNRNGRVTLVGDAAHAMTMYRGQAANHGVSDVKLLFQTLLPILQELHGEDEPRHERQERQKAAIDEYESTMIKRVRPAVLESRQAALDAHDYQRIVEGSPLVKTRLPAKD